MAEMNNVDESQRLDTLDARGNWVYPSGAESGHVELELPSLPGSPNSVERLLAKDVGAHVAGKIESSFSRQPYLQTGVTQSPDRIFRHYLGVVKGAHLVDSGTLTRMETLAREFEGESEQQEYFQQVLKPYLYSLSPKRRQS
ncbi:MAG TPA: hypothetical protein VJY15_03095 [Candidatus Acidoferrum sp.]|nr:hypothetical protein [Candidatus Acidoferrum sp.]